MQTNGQKLSAVARRRLLQDAGSTQPVSVASLASPVPVEVAIVKAPPLDRTPPEDNGTQSDQGALKTANQFTTLVESAAVNFSPSREVEQISRRSVKVRLSRGQKCTVLGTYVLWVKTGTVLIYGAVLTASTSVYRIYAPSSHALPSIEAATTNTEFQLESLDDGITHLPPIGLRSLWTFPGGQQSSLTFSLLGHPFEQDSKGPRRLKELNTTPWKSLLGNLSKLVAATPLRILVCGRRSSGLSTLVRCLVNRLLTTEQVDKDHRPSQGIVLLDLDTNLPEFVPPGIISLVHIGCPVFGAPFSNLLPPHQDSSGSVLRKHFFGDIDSTDITDWHLGRIHDLLDLERDFRSSHKESAMIMTVPGWLNNIDQPASSHLFNQLGPTDIICLDSSTNSTYLEPWQSFVNAGSCRVHQLPAQGFDKISAVRQHDLQMQSCFHQEWTDTGRPLWDEMPVLARTHRSITLGYSGDDAEICAIVLLGGHVALEDTFDALHESLVALVAVPRDVTQRRSSESIQRTLEDLPRWQGPSGPHSSFCFGLAIVREIDITNGKIQLTAEPELEAHRVQGSDYCVALVVPKATLDGRYRMNWAEREMARWTDDSSHSHTRSNTA